MANYQWTDNLHTHAFFNAGNWDIVGPGGGTTPATVPPGVNDSATIDNTAAAITGTGTAVDLIFQGTDEIAGHLTAADGIPVIGQLTLNPGAILTTPRLGVIAGALTVGKDSNVVIFGSSPLNDYAIKLAVGGGSNATMLVDGEHAVVNCRNLPMSVGQDGNGQMTIKNRAVVTMGNDDPLVYPWALVIGNHVTNGQPATGTVTVSGASLVARGQIIVGRKGTGTLDVNAAASVVAEDVTIGYIGRPSQVTVSDASLVARGQVIVGQYATGTLEVNAGASVVVDDMSIGSGPAGQGSVSVNGYKARLIVANELLVQDLGTGSLTVTGKGSVSVGEGIYVSGTLSLSDGQIETLALGLAAGATLTGHGTVTAVEGFAFDNLSTITAVNSLTLIGDMDNAGTITVETGGHLRCFGTISDTGSIELQANSVATVEAVQSQQTITFGGSNGRLELRSPTAFSGTIAGFAIGDTIELDFDVISHSIASSAGITVLNINGPSVLVAKLQFAGTYTSFIVSPAPPVPLGPGRWQITI